jgi:hypothetical protein
MYFPLSSLHPSDLPCRAIRKLNQTLSLLHHLVFGTTPIFNLRHKLYSTYYRPFNGLTHMFIVTFGRLCYADLPGWVDEQGRQDLLLSTGELPLDLASSSFPESEQT